jgi:DNA-binding GntR family transcriptional regulator
VEHTGRPLYLQIADDVRRRVLDGSLEPGAQLPSITELREDYGTSTTTVRQALAVLRGEGLIFGHQGKGSFVRPTKQRRRRTVGFYTMRPTTSPLGTAVEDGGERPSWDHRSIEVAATAAIAERLAIAVGAAVMATQYRFFANGEPIMLSTSHEPLTITRGTPIEHPEDGPVTGVVPRFDSIGMPITRVVEHVSARAARPYEVDALRIPPGVPVLAVERTYFATDRPVETADIVVAADTYTFSYELPVPDGDG